MAIGLSIVIPCKNEVDNVAPVARELAGALAGMDAEIIFIDDGSTDGTAAALAALKGELPMLRVLRHERNAEKSRAVLNGARAARGEIVVTFDGDGQNDPQDIARLIAPFAADPGKRIGIVAGVRGARRQDTASRKVASRLANGFRRWMLNDQATDTACGLKAFRREVLLSLPFFDNYHRYFITLVLREGYEARFVDVNDRARMHGVSKYTNFGRAMVGISDLFGVRWLQRRAKQPAAVREI
ncbi:MAG: glycosyltransferase family 2 protein [Rhizomicrobium sp.]